MKFKNQKRLDEIKRKLTLMISPTSEATNILSSFIFSFSSISCKKHFTAEHFGIFKWRKLAIMFENLIIDKHNKIIMLIVKITDFKTSTCTIFNDDAYIKWIGTCTDECIEIIMPQIAHLKIYNEFNYFIIIV